MSVSFLIRILVYVIMKFGWQTDPDPYVTKSVDHTSIKHYYNYFYLCILQLIPLLMQSLEQSEDDCASGDDEMIFSSLSTILAICDEDQNVFRSHLDSLVARLLRVAKNKQMKIRSASLKCLVKLSGYPPHTIVPLKKEVLRAIAPLLDDRKRLVRKDAVLCSNVWHLVG